MGYRDEYEALHQRLRLLEEELRGRERLEAASLEEELRCLREEVGSVLRRLKLEQGRLGDIDRRLRRLLERTAPESSPEGSSTVPITLLSFSLVLATAFAAWGAPASRFATPRLHPEVATSGEGLPEEPEAQVAWAAMQTMASAVEGCARRHAPQLSVVDVRGIFEGDRGRMLSVQPLVGGPALAACLNSLVATTAPLGPFGQPFYELTYAYPIRGDDWAPAFGPRLFQGPLPGQGH